MSKSNSESITQVIQECQELVNEQIALEDEKKI